MKQDNESSTESVETTNTEANALKHSTPNNSQANGVTEASPWTRPDSPLSPSESVKLEEARIQAMRDRDFIEDHGRLLRDITHSAFDPFRRAITPNPPYPKLRSLLACALVPMRIIVAFNASLISYMLVLTFGPEITKQTLHSYSTVPLPRWRRRVCEIATYITARGLLFALGFWRIHGTDAEGYDPNVKGGKGATIVSNHVGIGDPCLLAYLYAPSFVAKMLIAKIPFVGRVGSSQHSFYIDRFNNGARKTTSAIIERQHQAMDAALNIPPVAIFPEGTTTNGRYLLRFRTGAFAAGLPVAPVLLKYPYKYFPPSLEAIKANQYIWGLVTQPWNEVHYHRLPIYFPSAEERKDPALYADNVRLKMVEYSDFLDGKKFQLSNSNFIDKREYMAVLRGDKLQPGIRLR